MELPSISVVTPCLNAGATIGETLESVRTQGYPHVEHVIVDGGSSDGTLAVLASAPDVHWRSEPDRGRVEAANKGIALSSGEVVACLNADDRYHPGAFQAVGQAFRDNPQAAWVTGYCDIIDGRGREIRQGVTGYKNLLLRRWSVGLYLTQNFISDPATFVRREALDTVGPLDPRYKWSHDYDLWLRVARRFGPPVVLRRTLASFRMTEGSMSMAGFEGQFAEHLAVARRHGNGHRAAVAGNRAMSAAIVTVYRMMRLRRRFGLL